MLIALIVVPFCLRQMSARAGELFVKLRVPYMFVPPSGKRAAAKIAKTFAEFIDSVAEGYNEQHGTTLSPDEGLVHLIDSNIDPERLFDEYRGMAEQARGAIVNTKWANQDGFDDGYKWMTPEFSKWFLYNILPRPHKIDDETPDFKGRLDLYKVLVEHPRGEDFLVNFVTALRGFLYPGK